MIYYTEVNLFCIILLFLCLFQLWQQLGNSSTAHRVLRLIIWAALFLCVFDLTAGALRGRRAPGVWEILMAANLLYYEAMAIISFLWYLYVRLRLELPLPERRSYTLLQIAPLLIFTFAASTNPATNFLFSIDAQNLYHRGNGIFVHWVVVWGYFLVAFCQTLRCYLRESSVIKKQTITPMLIFAVAPLIASVIQMLFYGVTSTQVGITLSIVMICFSLQNAQVLTDALTNVNNRRGFEKYLEDTISRHANTPYMLLMLDVDSFKIINDTYGHIVGDLVLKDLCAVLKQTSSVLSVKLHLCRFGGDEFVFFGPKPPDAEITALCSGIDTALANTRPAENYPPNVTVSMGIATGKCTSEQDFRVLLTAADQSMYACKEAKRKSPSNHWEDSQQD